MCLICGAMVAPFPSETKLSPSSAYSAGTVKDCKAG